MNGKQNSLFLIGRLQELLFSFKFYEEFYSKPNEKKEKSLVSTCFLNNVLEKKFRKEKCFCQLQQQQQKHMLRKRLERQRAVNLRKVLKLFWRSLVEAAVQCTDRRGREAQAHGGGFNLRQRLLADPLNSRKRVTTGGTPFKRSPITNRNVSLKGTQTKVLNILLLSNGIDYSKVIVFK
ncbi:hypothetical protein CDAR_114401 [Caerostris darwini]|uniref:Uncharacterized protein n=1 Tax=Caerostris darwini TaxID=1538125 RepID=A0AAV4QXA6_9ARAC|nr:hypothetical protein CDAR_114401 [Caerostris darwini]